MQVLDDLAVQHRDAFAASGRAFERLDLELASTISSGEGAKTSLVTASWSGWISVLPSKPMSRP